MGKIIRQCIGVDCGMVEHVLTYSRINADLQVEHVSTLKIKNSSSGFIKLKKWVKKLTSTATPLQFVLEATGVYHESLARYLAENGFTLSVVLPNRARYFAKTLKIKTVNDKVSSQALAVMGLEKKLEPWSKPEAVYNELRQLTRERDQLVQERTQVKCQLHAETSGAWPNKSSISRMKQRISLLDKQVDQVEADIDQVLAKHNELKKTVERLTSIVGVGKLTVVTVLAETSEFNLVRNKKQLVSYAGLDVVEKTSGVSVRGKSRISHKGNKYLRKCLYFPAFSAIQHSKNEKSLFKRLVSKHGIKMKAAVAVQRKILVLIYSIWKNGTIYDPDYQQKKFKNELGQTRKSALKELA